MYVSGSIIEKVKYLNIKYNQNYSYVQLQHNKIIAFGGYDNFLKSYSKALWSN